MSKNNKNENDKIVSILSYFLVGIIWYAVDNNVKNKNTTFHVKQALNLLIINFVVSVCISILSIITFSLFGLIGILITITKVVEDRV